MYMYGIHLAAGAPGEFVGYPSACYNQFGGFNYHGVHILVGTFSRTKNDKRKARERECETFDENRLPVGILHPMCDKNKGTYRRGRDDTSFNHCLSIRSLRVKPPTSMYVTGK